MLPFFGSSTLAYSLSSSRSTQQGTGIFIYTHTRYKISSDRTRRETPHLHPCWCKRGSYKYNINTRHCCLECQLCPNLASLQHHNTAQLPHTSLQDLVLCCKSQWLSSGRQAPKDIATNRSRESYRLITDTDLDFMVS